jgi:hypothetical protein
MPDMQICRRSCAAARVVQRQQTIVGRVHSCYARNINVRTPTGHLLTLQGEGPLQAPLSLALAGAFQTLVPSLPVGTLVVQHVLGISAPPAALRLRDSGAVEWDGRIESVPALTILELHRKTSALAAWIERHVPNRGLAPLLPAFQGSDATLSGVCRRVYDTLAPLLAEPELSPVAVLETTTQILGLGEGLTPSGDDLLVGLLAVLHITGRLEEVFPSAAHQRVLQDVLTQTSDLSAEFIRCALEGDFAEPVALFVRSLFALGSHEWHAYARSLAAVGHSSGVDAMVGIMLGCRLLARLRHS